VSRDALKRAACEAIDARREQIVSLGETILRHPETGFKETRTARLVADTLQQLGLEPQTGLAVTGVRARLEAASPGPTLAIMGELDALVVPEHPHADPKTGAAHACGHHVQIAATLGAAIGLTAAQAPRHLAGSLVFFAVPAEEFIEVEERLELRKNGKLEFLIGKPELIRLGYFDDVDLAMMMHAIGDAPATSLLVDSSNGSVIKRVRFLGKAAHAGATPQKGINALNAATLALSAIHMQRETFWEDDTIRVHPIVTKGGDSVSVVPAEVTVETHVRGKTQEALLDANAKVDRCMRAGAMAIGATVEIETIPGYLPQLNNRAMGELFGANIAALLGEAHFQLGGHRTSSTDMGDVGHLMPVIHPYIGGGTGVLHSADFRVVDPDLAYVTSAKLLAMTAIDLLADDARAARHIKATHTPRMTKAQYLEGQRRLFATARYGPDGSMVM
jgi:amidohydrolase